MAATDHVQAFIDLAITPGGRVGDASPLGTHGPRRLTDYEREIAHALMRKRGFSKSHAIATAKNATRKWAAGGGHVRPQVRAGAAASVAQSAALRGRSHALSTPGDEAVDDIDLAAFRFKHGWVPLGGGSGGNVTAQASPGRVERKRGRKAVKGAAVLEAARREAERREAAHRGGGPGWTSPARTGGYRRSPRATRHAHSALPGFSTVPRALDIALAEAHARDLDLGWTPSLHPRDWRGRFALKNALRGPLDENRRPIPTRSEDYAYAKHLKAADRLIIDHSSRLSTDNDGVNGTTLPDGTIEWSDEREKMHKDVVNTVYRRAAKSAKSDRKAIFLGGLPGAGKSTSIKRIPGLDEKDYVTINPDIFKEELAQRGLLPKLEGLTPMEASAFVHEESSTMALMLAELATKNGKNIIWDITMGSSGSVTKRLKPLNEAGYRSQAMFVDIPFEMSQRRVEQRHKGGILSYWRDTTGTHLGQRLVPSTHVMSGKSKTGSTSANRDAFEAVKHLFAAHKTFDNSGKDPKLIGRRGKFAV